LLNIVLNSFSVDDNDALLAEIEVISMQNACLIYVVLMKMMPYQEVKLMKIMLLLKLKLD